MMSDLKLGTNTHDLVINNFNFELTEDTDESVAQKWKIRLLFFKGEYFLNINFGIPYFKDILKKQSDLTIPDVIFRDQTLLTPGIEEILEYESILNKSRVLNVDIKVRSQTDSELFLTFTLPI